MFMDYFKKNGIWLLLFLLGIFLIYNSITYGRTYFVNYITHNQLNDPDKFNLLLDKSILRYMIIGTILSIFSILQIKK